MYYLSLTCKLFRIWMDKIWGCKQSYYVHETWAVLRFHFIKRVEAKICFCWFALKKISGKYACGIPFSYNSVRVRPRVPCLLCCALCSALLCIRIQQTDSFLTIQPSTIYCQCITYFLLFAVTSNKFVLMCHRIYSRNFFFHLFRRWRDARVNRIDTACDRRRRLWINAFALSC